jgi:hypothetical protein
MGGKMYSLCKRLSISKGIYVDTHIYLCLYLPIYIYIMYIPTYKYEFDI